MMRLQFFGRKTNSEGDIGPHIRVNTGNGNFKLSPSVINKCGISVKDKINFSYVEGENGEIDAVYMALEPRGLTLGENHAFSSSTHAVDMKSAYSDQMESGHNVLILSVDVENPVEAETDRESVQAYELTFVESQKAKAAPGTAAKSKKASKKTSEEAIPA